MTQLLFPLTSEPIAQPRSLCTVVIPPLDGEYLYEFDPIEHSDLSVGDAIQVSLGRREASAFVISVNSQRELSSYQEISERSIRIKKISSDTLRTRAFTSEHLDFFSWVAKYYAEPLSKILDLAIPTPAFGRPIIAFQLTELGQDYAGKLTTTQSSVIRYLKLKQGAVSLLDLQTACGASRSVCNTLMKRGLLTKAAISREQPLPTAVPSPCTLNAEQENAVEAIRPSLIDRSFSTFLLQGVTGSGKTEVYLNLIIEALARGLSALVVVPEIALTPQLTDRFSERLKQPVAVLHSGLKASERWRHWSDLASGAVRVAIGARSAIFAPVENLGLVIVDEEHDSSFKQNEGIRYHARDLAMVRAKHASCPVVLGSATPSLETYHHAVSGKYQHLTLSKQFYSAEPPTFEIIDLTAIKPWQMPSKSISPKFLASLSRALEAGGQAFILYNRRGFARYLQCSSCEYVIGCPHCSVTLTYHQTNNSLLCHQCGFSLIPPLVCHGCGKSASADDDGEPLFSERGSGTERVHEELATLLPQARVAKLDRDSASTIADYVEILGKVRERKVDILVGTQMIAKGHDLPDVTFVGIVDCDVGLHMPDFRAAERGFQLLTQVAGRAGRRATQGHVVLQTRVPQHPSLVMTAGNNFARFAEQELQLRQRMGYPPFVRLLRIVVSGEDRAGALTYASSIAQYATEHMATEHVTILGPAPAPLEKIRGLWRYHILVKSPSHPTVQHIMQRLKRERIAPKNIRVAFDLEPLDML